MQTKYSNIFETKRLHSNLKQRSLRSGLITLIAKGLSLVIQIGSMMILARILTPGDYGLMTMAAAITGFANVFSNLGLSTATIQRANINHAQVSTLFWINTGLGILLSLIIASLSPAVVWFYQKPELFWVMLALSSKFFISALAVQHRALLNRQLRFLSLSVIEISSMLFSITIGIIAGMKGFGYWALVMSSITLSIATTVGVWVALRWLPGLPRPDAKVRSMVLYGFDIMGFNIVNYFARNLDNILIGKFCGSSILGLYNKAYQLLMMPITNLRDPLNRVAMPTLSRLQDDHEQYRNYYMKFISMLAFLSMPFIAFMFVCSDEIILLALGPQWIEASILFKILSLVAFIQPVASTPGMVLLSMGKSKKYLIMGVVKALLVSLFFIIGLSWGVMGIATAYVIIVYLALFPSLMYSFSDTPVCVKDFIISIYKPFIASLVSGFICFLVLKSIASASVIVVLALCFIGCSVVYILTFIAIAGNTVELHEYYIYFQLMFAKNKQAS